MSQATIAIVVGDFHKTLAEEMVGFAEAEAGIQGATVARVVQVAGSYEAPLLVDTLLQRDGIDAVVVLGCIEQGETLHGEVMGHVVHQALMNLQLRYQKAVGFGIIGPGATHEQAEERKEMAARGAVRAVVRSQQERRRLQKG